MKGKKLTGRRQFRAERQEMEEKRGPGLECHSQYSIPKEK